ncbi:MAG: T9SS type A sorting domain-containing protein, partial [Candidatus Eisenbacteria bacterium]|nr:T9SS type A sorting domain-containing protein [Candidatus Eisenbacteria bacterium]
DTFEFEIIDVKMAGGPWSPGDATPNDRSGGKDSEISLSVAGPVSNQATVYFSVPEPCRALVSVYNVAGREVGVVVDGDIDQGPGSARLYVAADRLPSGVYFVRMRATGMETGRSYTRTSKMLVVR